MTLRPPLDVVAAGRLTLGAGWAWCGRAVRGRRPGNATRAAIVRTPAADATRDPRRAPARDARRPSAHCVVGSRSSRAPSSPRRRAARARITVLDVGQGDAILVEGSRGGRLLIEAVPIPIALLVALDRRIPPWDRRIDAVDLPPARGPRRWAGPPPRALPRRPRVRTWDDGPGPGYAAWARRLLARALRFAWPGGRGSPDVDEIAFPRPLADPRPGSIPAGRGGRPQQRLGRASARSARNGVLTATSRGHRPIAPGRGVAAGRLAQGGAPRQQDRDQEPFMRPRGQGGRGVGGRRQPVWSPAKWRDDRRGRRASCARIATAGRGRFEGDE